MKKYLTDNFGYTLRNIRENLKLTQTEVFQGILARSTWCNYESEVMVPDMITFITLLERMGVSSDRFEFIVPEEVHKFYEWYEDCQNYIENEAWDMLREKRSSFKINKQINEKIQYQCRDFIDYVIERFADKNLDKAFLHIRQALMYTVSDIDNIVENKMLLSVFEGHLLINYYDLMAVINTEKTEKITKILYTFYNYYKCRLKDDLIRKKILPRIVILILKHDKNVINKDERLKLEYESLEILIKNASIREVAEILKHMIKDEKAYYMVWAREKHIMALSSILNKFGFSPDFRVEVLRIERRYLILGDILKLRRKELGLTMEEVAGNICAVSTYARAESGKASPNRNTLGLLKERLKLRAVYYSSEIETNDYGILIFNSECRRLVATGRYDEAEEKYKELSDKIDMGITVNRQIIGFSGLYTLLNRNDSLVRLWELLPYNELDFEQITLFSREELEVLSLIAKEKALADKAEGIHFIETVLEKEGRRRSTYYARTAIINRDLVKLLKDNKEYEKSYKLAIAMVKKMFIENDSGLLLDMLDFISTIEEDLGNKAGAAKICKDMFYISELYEMYDAARSIKEYYSKVFNKNEKWY